MSTAEVYANDAQGAVTSGGTTAPVSGTVETWTVNVQIAFPTATPGSTQFHVADPATGMPTEKILVTSGAGAVGSQTWTVTRGAESTTPLAHAAGFTIRQALTAGVLAGLLPLAGGTMQGWFAPSVVALSQSGGAVAVNAAAGNVFALTLTASGWAISNPASPTDGQQVTIRLIQDATGGRTVTWGTAFDFGAAGAPTLSTGANKVDLARFEYVASLSKWCCLGTSAGF